MTQKGAIPCTVGIAAAVVSCLSGYKGQVGESREFVASVAVLQQQLALLCCRTVLSELRT
jgi:hypothetical protein